MNIPEIIKQIQAHKSLLKYLDSTTQLQNCQDDFKQILNMQIDRLIARLPDKMPYPGDNNYFGYKNGDQFSELSDKFSKSNPRKSGYIQSNIGGKKI
jgi:hypothetical protein